MVRLEPIKSISVILNLSVSIPLWYDWNGHNFDRYCFDLFVSIPLWYDWNTLVVLPDEVKERFNSIMVRLEPFISSENPHLSNWFQFHYGTIGTNSMPRHHKFSTLFQFHYGTIGTGWIWPFIKVKTIVSIPLWYDWNAGRH